MRVNGKKKMKMNQTQAHWHSTLAQHTANSIGNKIEFVVISSENNVVHINPKLFHCSLNEWNVWSINPLLCCMASSHTSMLYFFFFFFFFDSFHLFSHIFSYVRVRVRSPTLVLWVSEVKRNRRSGKKREKKILIKWVRLDDRYPYSYSYK